MKKELESEIRERVETIGQNQRSCVEQRIELGTIAIALQKLHGDVDPTGRPSYRPAKELILKWIGKTSKVCEKSLEVYIYIALRTSAQQIEVLANAGASVTAIHASVQACEKKGKGEWVRYVALVKAGKARVTAHEMKRFNSKSRIDLTPDADIAGSRRGEQHGLGDGCLCEVRLRGDEDNEACQLKVVTLFSAFRAMGRSPERIREMADAALVRVGK